MRTMVISRVCLVAALICGLALAAAGFVPQPVGASELVGACGGDCSSTSFSSCKDLNSGCCENYTVGTCVGTSGGNCEEVDAMCYGDEICRIYTAEQCY